MKARLIKGEVPAALAPLANNSIDACVTDPPYGIGFMGKEWDTFKPGRLTKERPLFVDRGNPNLKGRKRSRRNFQAWTEQWAREVMRVLKPGSYLLCCAAPRSYHRIACGIEDAGFEVRDCILWLFGQGFPKSLNLKGEFKGWGTALKPAWEPVLMARKPLVGTVQKNMRQFGTGAINIDAGRIPGVQGSGVWGSSNENCAGDKVFNASPEGSNYRSEQHTAGRWPANVIHDGNECVIAGFPDVESGKPCGTKAGGQGNAFGVFAGGIPVTGYGDSGSAARFFYCAKASRADRDDGMAGFEKKPLRWSSVDQSPGTFQSPNTDCNAHNHHPTVKPTELMRYLCTLVTPPSGIVLDPFMGSGSTGRGALLGGFQFIGIEREEEYVEIARVRIRAISPLFVEVQ